MNPASGAAVGPAGRTVAELLAQAGALPEQEARRLLEAASDRSASELRAGPNVGDEAAERFLHLVTRRAAGEPLQYLEGTVQFGPIELDIDERALIPRPETEQLWELAAARLSVLASGAAEPVVVDLCTGSGNLALALKHAVPTARVLATDISQAALALAEQNGLRTALHVELLQGDLFSPLPETLRGTVDLIVANPPYVTSGEVAALPPEVRDHEPIEALVAGDAGTEVLARIADGAVEWLRPGGHLLCEISEFQTEAVRTLFATYDPEVLPDLAGRPRFVVGVRSDHR